MSDAAQGEPIRHEVFSTPFQVTPKFELWKTPSNYREYPEGDKLPGQLKVWRVQDSGKDYGSVVAYSYGFEDSPDAEALTPGYNVGKNSGAVGVGRQGNFLQWGFSEPPSKMTEAGRRFFLNCIVYIHKFDGKAPLVQHRALGRVYGLFLASLASNPRASSVLSHSFPAEVVQKYAGNPSGLAEYYRQNIELVYSDKGFIVDEELKSLGIDSNRKVETLEKLVELLKEPSQSALAAKLLKRYTNENFVDQAQWQGWLTKVRDRVYFTDVGGYKFMVAPEGYSTSK